MISNICYALVFLIEALISFYYFDFKFERRIDKKLIPLFIVLSGLLLFAFNLFKIPIMNAISFYALNFAVLLICYKTGVRSAIFTVSVLLLIMIATELIIIFIFSALFSFSPFESQSNNFVLIIESVLCKLLYFILIWVILKISEKEDKTARSPFSITLCALPIASVISMHTTVYICITYSISEKFEFAIVISDILVLLSNILVFYVHELTIKTNKKYTQILLEQQHEKNTENYYKLLMEREQNSRVLIHDITKHLGIIKQLSNESGSNAAVSKYISEILEDFSVMNPVKYCNSPVINLITHRYREICAKRGIKLNISLPNINTGSLKEHDLTALLDNLLENAVEAAENSVEKFINFSICKMNTNFLVIKISNSCDKKPKYSGGRLVSSKKSDGIHGIGTQSIKRAAAKYSGSVETDYNDESKTFTSIVVLKTNVGTVSADTVQDKSQ